jgi:hypothetical protein
MKSDRATLAPSPDLIICWRRVCRRAISVVRRLVGIDHDVVAVGVGRPEADDAAGLQFSPPG